MIETDLRLVVEGFVKRCDKLHKELALQGIEISYNDLQKLLLKYRLEEIS